MIKFKQTFSFLLQAQNQMNRNKNLVIDSEHLKALLNQVVSKHTTRIKSDSSHLTLLDREGMGLSLIKKNSSESKLKTWQDLSAWQYYSCVSLSRNTLETIPRELFSGMFLNTCKNLSSLGKSLDHIEKLIKDLVFLDLAPDENEWKLVILILKKCHVIDRTKFVLELLDTWGLEKTFQFQIFIKLLVDCYSTNQNIDGILEVSKFLSISRPDPFSDLSTWLLDLGLSWNDDVSFAKLFQIYMSLSKDEFDSDFLFKIVDWYILKAPIYPTHIEFLCSYYTRKSFTNPHLFQCLLLLCNSHSLHTLSNDFWLHGSKGIRSFPETTMHRIESLLAQKRQTEATNEFRKLTSKLRYPEQRGVFRWGATPNFNTRYLDLCSLYNCNQAFSIHTVLLRDLNLGHLINSC